MKPSLKLRVMERADLPFADEVRSQAGWNQTRADWERFLATEPGGCFVAEWDGAPAGTATTTIYGGGKLAWIGMVLVHSGFRRRGIGSALLERCIAFLHERGVRCIKLDATPLGKMVYDKLGFKEEWTLARWERPAEHPRTQARVEGIRELVEGDLPGLEQVDTAAFGVPRSALIRALAASGGGFVSAGEGGRLGGYSLSRPGTLARYLGPCSAASSAAGIRLMESLVARFAGERMFWDIPDPNGEAVEWARGNGFSPQRTLIRMYLGDNSAGGDPTKQFAIAGPEVG